MTSIKDSDFVVKSNNIFLEEDYGKPIDEKLSRILRRNVSKNDYANIAAQSRVSFSTLRDVVYRTNSLTKNNAKGVSLLIHIALENCIEHRLQAENDLLFLNKLLKL